MPPTGAKGLNLAVSDVAMLGEALIEFFEDGSSHGVDGYSARALARVWKAERFSWWFTGLMHRFPGTDAFARKMQVAELDYIRSLPCGPDDAGRELCRPAPGARAALRHSSSMRR